MFSTDNFVSPVIVGPFDIEILQIGRDEFSKPEVVPIWACNRLSAWAEFLLGVRVNGIDDIQRGFTLLIATQVVSEHRTISFASVPVGQHGSDAFDCRCAANVHRTTFDRSAGERW